MRLHIGDVAGYVLNGMGSSILKGVVFSEGISDKVLADGYNALIKEYPDDDCIYVLLPDENNKLPGDDGCQAPYSYQLQYADIIHQEKVEEK